MFHGHAHNGIVEGKTLGMCRSLMSRYLFSRVRLRGSFFCTSCDGNAGEGENAGNAAKLEKIKSASRASGEFLSSAFDTETTGIAK